jgi:superfamily II DNA/RNA helicase
MRLLTIRSAHTQQERSEVIYKFNDPSEKVDVLVTSLALSSVGINLHRCAHRMIFLEFPRNINTLLQALSRLRRMNQKHEQEIAIVMLQNSFDTYLEAQAADKYAIELLATLPFPDHVTPKGKLVLAHLVIANMLGQSCSKYMMNVLDFPFLPELKNLVQELTESALHHLESPDDEARSSFLDKLELFHGQRDARKIELKRERSVKKAVRANLGDALGLYKSDAFVEDDDTEAPATPTPAARRSARLSSVVECEEDAPMDTVEGAAVVLPDGPPTPTAPACTPPPPGASQPDNDDLGTIDDNDSNGKGGKKRRKRQNADNKEYQPRPKRARATKKK